MIVKPDANQTAAVERPETSFGGFGVDPGSLLPVAGGPDPSLFCRLLAGTALGQTLVLLEQQVLRAALDVYTSDPFPLEPAGWDRLLEGSPGEFLAPRGLFALSYFLTVENRRWEARVAACRALSAAAREVRADGLEQVAAEARSAEEAWRCVAGCDPLRGPTPRELWQARRELPPLPAIPAAPEGPVVIDALLGKLARARLDPREAATPLDPREADPQQLLRYAWARKQFRGEAGLLAALDPGGAWRP